MSRDIVADIVRRALQPQPALHGDMVPGESPIEERLRLLQESLEGAKERMLAQARQLEALRADIARYKSGVDATGDRLDRVQAHGWAFRQAACRRDTVASNSISETAPAPAARLVRHWAWPLPYAAMALGAVLLALTFPRPPRRSLSVAAVPAPPALPSLPMPSEERNDEVLALIYAYVPPGRSKNVREILAPEIEGAAGSPWVFARVDEKTTLVSFRPYGEALANAPVYEFAVDPLTKVVFPSPETVQNLRGAAVAAR